MNENHKLFGFLLASLNANWKHMVSTPTIRRSYKPTWEIGYHAQAVIQSAHTHLYPQKCVVIKPFFTRHEKLLESNSFSAATAISVSLNGILLPLNAEEWWILLFYCYLKKEIPGLINSPNPKSIKRRNYLHSFKKKWNERGKIIRTCIASFVFTMI